MTAATLTLTDFLLARIAQDEATARAGASNQTDPEDGWGYEGRALTPHVGIIHEAAQAAHIMRWHPYRVLAECEAKRRIVEAFEDERVRRDIYNRDYDSGECVLNQNDLRARLGSNARCRGIEIAMLALAAVYADHPDCRDEWRP